MEFTNIDKINIEKMYKKYGEKLVSKIVKKQDKLKMSESLRSTMRKMRKQEGGNAWDDMNSSMTGRDRESQKYTELNNKVGQISTLYNTIVKSNEYSINAFNEQLEMIKYNNTVYKWFKDRLDEYNMYKSAEYNLAYIQFKKKKNEAEIKKFEEVAENINNKIKIKENLDELSNFLSNLENDFSKKKGIYHKFKQYIESNDDKKFPKDILEKDIKSYLIENDILAHFFRVYYKLKVNKPDLEDYYHGNLDRLYDRLKKSLQEKNVRGNLSNPKLFKSYPIQNDQTIYQENPDSEENLSLKYNPNFLPMQQLPVAVQPVQQPVAFQQPVAVQPVAVQPVAVQPVAVQPVVVQQPVILK